MQPSQHGWWKRGWAALLALLLTLSTVPIPELSKGVAPGDLATGDWSPIRIVLRSPATVFAASKVDSEAGDEAGSGVGDEAGNETDSEVKDPAFAAMQLRLQTVFNRLARQIAAHHPELSEYTIEPVKEKVPNAWINQKHEIYVTSGLLELLEEDDALAGVIGHEIAHGTQGHIPHRINQSLWSAFAVIALGTIASTQGSSDWGGLLHMRDLFMYAFSREQESEADLVGMRYARDAGYRPEGLVEALKAMDDERRRIPDDSVWQQLYRTHPPMARRITDLRLILATEQLAKVPFQGVELGGNLRDTLRGNRAATIGAAANSPEEVALGFGRALFKGDEVALRKYVLPGRAGTMLDRDTGYVLHGPGGRLESDVGDGARDGAGDRMDGGLGNSGSDDDDQPSLPDSFGEDFANDFDADPDWSHAEIELLRRDDAELSTVLIIRLWRPATVAEVVAGLGTGRDGAEIGSLPLKLTLQQSARGWVVTAWEPWES